MGDPYQAALDALFWAPGSSPAIFQPAEGSPIAIRVIRSAPDRTTGFGDSRVLDNAATLIEIRRSEVNAPASGDFIAIEGRIVDGQVVGGEVFEIFGDPVLDLERIGWTCGVELREP
ncbi:hypothetical protein ASE75_06050 [Sphingomonas sp. Leaf17]|uniref:head-tail joining protein n=1 Tax=Sphingomonas sp. Leaf17 TaxID=1735683 RepID=UPI0006FAE015|nr:hypothetical protein [Sphingomonas sp. Leaf17]KQM65791.1 hypothetical protein ASE75_06050 [Sphingomonas sp. Leaf17]